MKKLILAILTITLLATATYVWATATSETGDTSAVPVMLYGKTSGGAFKQLLVDADGILQTTT